MDNLRRLLKTPTATLRLIDGGQPSPWSLRGAYRGAVAGATDLMERVVPIRSASERYAARAPQPDAVALPTAAPAPVEQPRAITDYASDSALRRREAAAGLANGGEVNPLSLRGMYRGAVGGATDLMERVRPFQSATERYAARAPLPPAAVAPAAALPPVAPTGIAAGIDGQGGASGDIEAQSRRYGFNDGGQVPGRGGGDKIPALYEPGEFVASNDMLRRNPGLRENLHEMRNEALAAKGMTPEEADANALRRGGMRAANGYDPLGSPTGEYDGQDPQAVVGPGVVVPGDAGGAGAPRPGLPAPRVPGGPAGGLSDQFMPGVRATLRASGDDASQALNKGNYAGAAGNIVRGAVALPVAAVDDVVGGALRGAYGLIKGPAEDAGRAALGMPERPSAPLRPADPPQTQRAAPAPADTSPLGPQSPQEHAAGELDGAGHQLASLRGAGSVDPNEEARRVASGRAVGAADAALADQMQSDRVAGEQAGLVAQQAGLAADQGISDRLDSERARWNAGVDLSSISKNRDQRAAATQTLRDMDARDMNRDSLASSERQHAAATAASVGNNMRTTAAVLRGQQMTAQTARALGMRDQANKDRQFAFDAEKTGFEQQQSSRKAMDARIDAQFPGADGKPDPAAAADFKKSVALTLGTLAKEAAARGDTARAARLSKMDYADMDSEDEAEIWRLYRNKQTAQQNAGLTSGNFVDSQDLTNFRPDGVDRNTLRSDAVRYKGGSSILKNDAQQRSWLGLGPAKASDMNPTILEAELRQRRIDAANHEGR